MNRPSNQKALVFPCHGDRLVGVLAEPDVPPAQTGVVIVVGGPQYRVGSHRQFVQLADALAAAGFATLRFDVRGMGDSEGKPRDFERIDDDIAAAIDALIDAQPSVSQVVLWGLCDGASAALLYLSRRRDPRVRAIALVNPWVHDEAAQARVRVKEYYVGRLFQRSFWAKLMAGQVAWRAIGELASSITTAVGRRMAQNVSSDAQAQRLERRLARAWSGFSDRVLLVLSENDYTAMEFLDVVRQNEDWQAIVGRPGVTRVDIAGADHTFSQPEAKAMLVQATVAWLRNWSSSSMAEAGSRS